MHSTFKHKSTLAYKILREELNDLFMVTKLQQTGPYQLQSTVKILSETYKCQFFIFSGYTGKRKLCYMFPDNYDDTFLPVFLYQPMNEPSHLIFIKNLNSYFRANYSVCFQCKKQFSSFLRKHLCPQRPTCFACRRFFKSANTCTNEQIDDRFCDKFTTIENEFVCKICNVNVYSQHCLKGHKRLCNGLGRFGYKCLDCKKFRYVSNETSDILRKNHVCDDKPFCKFCYQLKDTDHLCKLRASKFPKFHNRLAFINLELEFDETELSKNILFALIYKEEEQRGLFHPTVIADDSEIVSSNSDIIVYDYFLSETKNTSFALLDQHKKSKKSADFNLHFAKISSEKDNDISKQLISFLLSSENTTFICQDSDGKQMVLTNRF